MTKKEKKKIWTLLWVWNAFIPVHTFNGEDYIALFAFKEAIKWLEEEIKSLRGYADNLDSENDNQAIEIEELKKENKKLKEELETATKCSSQEEWKLRNLEKENKELEEENKKLKETIKDHQFYEEKLEHRIIELEELLHWE